MKLKYIIGILALFLLMVGTASANPYDLTLSNEESNGHIWVHVDYANGILTYTDKSSNLLTGSQTLTSDSGILSIAISNEIPETSVRYITGTKEGVTYVLYSNDPDDHPVSAAIGNHDWEYQGGAQGFSNFGDFDTTYGSSSANEYSEVKVYFVAAGPVLEANDDGHIFAVHYRLGIMEDSTSVLAGTFFATDGPETPIPEFPTIALPVAAVIGIMFIMGSRKKE